MKPKNRWVVTEPRRPLAHARAYGFVTEPRRPLECFVVDVARHDEDGGIRRAQLVRAVDARELPLRVRKAHALVLGDGVIDLPAVDYYFCVFFLVYSPGSEEIPNIILLEQKSQVVQRSNGEHLTFGHTHTYVYTHTYVHTHTHTHTHTHHCIRLRIHYFNIVIN